MPFPDQSFDRVVSQFVLMFVEDRAAAAAEMRRVLRPRGTVAAVTWAAVEESPGYAAMVALLDRLFGAGPADALRAPFTLGTTSSLVEALCGEFPDVTVHRWAGVARFASVRAWVHTDVAGWTLRDLIDEEQYERLQSEAAVALDRFVGVDGAVRFDAPALAAVATRS
jgi:SAM-dependent methyltransferase